MNPDVPAAGDPVTGSRKAPGARERIRQELTAEILAVARDHLAGEGAAALSLRSIARDLDMAPSALYRYFDGRDALLSALIRSAYESLADEAERAAERARATRSDAARWAVVPRALRSWALAHPHEWGLIFGTPVPGYQAPEDTVEPYARVAAALAAPLIEAEQGHRLRSVDTHAEKRPPPSALRAAVAPVADFFAGAEVHTVVGALEAWTTVVGAISLEVFGHWRNTILDPEEYFETVLSDLAWSLGLR
jgi:AcrR family transcriptional regulator